MDCKEFASGDSKTITQSTDMKEDTFHDIYQGTAQANEANETDEATEEMEENKEIGNQDAISTRMIDENEIKLKERVAQCKSIIASLKLELNEEKIKLEKDAKEVQLQPKEPLHGLTSNNAYSFKTETDFPDSYNVNLYSASVDRKLNCDESLMEYEKQLQRYQNTLNMAQVEKKNAIRKQMLANAFKLKLMEVENQCNIELLRIKQSLQCLEPLKMIIQKWKVNSNDNVDLINFELIPRYPELSANSGSDITNTSSKDNFNNKITTSNLIEKHE
ncbi:uncharacterized protein LOC123867297 [Maniola jurtina]|uniref:uncharacterized protein LOC123867297 n=1 Tax=Maniola jurtina TaxID=191418 RepID=UPI001E686C56|nr:uncharacterized protein LOC123867297 [Maniola jurtina]